DRPATRAEPQVLVTRSSPTGLTLRAERSPSPYYLVVGQAFDDRWKATMDGIPLGKPLLIDGYSIGWRVDRPGPHTFRVDFAPQRWAIIAQLISIAAVTLALVLLVRGRRRSTDLGAIVRREGD